MTPPWIALGWQVGSLTGWGTFGAGLCRSLIDAGHQVILPVSPDFAGLSPFDKAPFAQLVGGMPTEESGWLLMPLGNGLEPKPQALPSNVKVCGLCVFEDSGALDDEAVERLRQYDCLVAPSRWVQSMLSAKGLDAPVCHQGYDARVFFPAPYDNDAPKPSRPLVFSGGKLEFRKGQDIVVDAFRRFRATPQGKDAILVTCWDNPWPKTMDGIWLAGYVTGVPTVRHGKADMVGWLGVNGVPPEAVIDCGKLSQAELAQVMRQCTVGVFPSRAEGATNLVLVEALACGLPCIAVDGHGHGDVPVSRKVFGSTDSVVQGCQLYRSTNGWSEADPDSLAKAIADVPPIVPCTGEYWSWAVRGPALIESIFAHDRVAA